MRILRNSCIACVRAYQWLISPLFLSLGVQCRFSPTCSEYAVQAIELHGPFRGIALACYRLARCQPFCRAGHDPVPPRSVRCC